MHEEQEPAAPENEGADDAPQGETKAQKFKRLAEPRVENAIRKIALIGNLSSSSYDYNYDQMQKILKALRDAVDEVEKKMRKGLGRKGYDQDRKFSL